MGMLLAILIMAPWWVRNAIHFGNPLHSTQNYMVEGGSPSTGSKYAVYWDKPNPSFWTSKLPLGLSHVAKRTKAFLDTHLEWVFVVMYPKPGADPPIDQPQVFPHAHPTSDMLQRFPQVSLRHPHRLFRYPCDYWAVLSVAEPEKSTSSPLLSVRWCYSSQSSGYRLTGSCCPTVALIAALGWTSLFRISEQTQRLDFSRLGCKPCQYHPSADLDTWHNPRLGV